MKKITKMIVVLFLFIILITSVQFLRVYNCIKLGNENIEPWQRSKPNAVYKVLFAGDSTAVGTGVSDNAQSTAGLLSRDFPDFDVENHSRNGLRLKGLVDVLKGVQDRKFDLAILQIGANDILYFTPIQEIQKDERRVLDLAKNIAGNIIILHSGDIGQSPLFIWPFNWVYTWRSLKVREIYSQSQDDRVSYIDIYARNKGVNYSDCYARDHLHLNARGYAIWYGFIKDQLQAQDWL